MVEVDQDLVKHCSSCGSGAVLHTCTGDGRPAIQCERCGFTAYAKKPRTWFIDIDGVVIKHHNKGIVAQLVCDKLIIETVETLSKLEAMGDHIVLVTARPETYRAVTERHLQHGGVPYHQLVMGVTSGERIIVNDGPGKASARCLVRNEGLHEC